jgi:hypothetical protein
MTNVIFELIHGEVHERVTNLARAHFVEVISSKRIAYMFIQITSQQIQSGAHDGFAGPHWRGAFLPSATMRAMNR